MPFGVAFLVGSLIADGPVNRGRRASVFAIGAVLCAAGSGWLALAHEERWQFLVGAAVLRLGCSIGYAAGFTIIQLAVAEEKAGMAAGIAGTATAIGAAIGAAVVTRILSASTVLIPGTEIGVPDKAQHGTSFWAMDGASALVIVVVLIARAYDPRQARQRA